MHFVTQKESPEQKPESVKSSVEQSDSLYQMLQVSFGRFSFARKDRADFLQKLKFKLR